MIINPRENTIVMSTILNFPSITLDNGIKVYYELKNDDKI